MPSSPALKQPRVEDVDPLVPPFHLPPSPPARGFPPLASLLSPAASPALDGHRLLLDASSTLALPPATAIAALASLRRHRTHAALRDRLTALTAAHLADRFDDAEAIESDTRRRLDETAALEGLRANATRRLSRCVSALTRGQHMHYRAWVATHMRTGLVPRVAEGYPDLHAVLDLAAREQTLYLRKFMEEAVGCAQCKMDAGANRQGDGNIATHRVCGNHNYMDAHVETYARRWWRARLTSRLVPLLQTPPVAIAHEKAAIADVRRPPRGNGEGVASHEAPRGVLTSFTREAAVRGVGATLQHREANGQPRLFPSALVPPSLPLPTRQLDGWATSLHPKTGGEERLPLPPVLAPSVVPGVSCALRVCKSALVELATAHLAGAHAGCRLPVVCVWNETARRVDISLGKPLPGALETRRNTNAAVLKRLIEAEVRLPTNSRCASGGKCVSEVTFDKFLAFQLVSNCHFDINGQHPVFRVVKMEYNCKGYNSIPDDPTTLHYEMFSKWEVVRMWLLLQCNPTAVLYVYRVNAYSSAVIGIEQFSSASFASQVWSYFSSDAEVSRVWSSLRDVLTGLIKTATRRFCEVLHEHEEQKQTQGAPPPQDGAPSSPFTFTFILSKEKQYGEVFLSSVLDCYPQLTVSLDEAVENFLEASSRAVCRREYRPPCVWPYPDRIPYTFGPKPPAALVVNRTTETRHDSEFYAAHDVWRHESHFYSVDGDGIIRERVPEEENEEEKARKKA